MRIEWAHHACEALAQGQSREVLLVLRSEPLGVHAEVEEGRGHTLRVPAGQGSLPCCQRCTLLEDRLQLKRTV